MEKIEKTALDRIPRYRRTALKKECLCVYMHSILFISKTFFYCLFTARETYRRKQTQRQKNIFTISCVTLAKNTLHSNHFKDLTMHACLLAFFFAKQGNVTVAQFLWDIDWKYILSKTNNKDIRTSELLIYIIELKNQFSLNYSV